MTEKTWKEKLKDWYNPKVLTYWRYWAFLVIPVCVILATGLTSPDGWADPKVKLLGIAWSAIALFLTHSSRSALMGYVRLFDVYKKAMETSEGAGKVFIGVCILMGLIFLALVPLVARADVPPNAHQILPLVSQEIERYYPDIPRRSYVGALIEKESCIHAKHPTCFTSKARLKTAREEGAGLGQFTRAYDRNGNLRFDALAEVKTMNPEALKEFSWENVYERSDLGVRAILVKHRDCDLKLRKLSPKMDPMERLNFCDAAYNGGYTAMQAERKLCASAPPCNPNVWFQNVEHHSNKSRTTTSGYGESWFDINRRHVRETTPFDPPSKRAKYIPYLGV